MGGTPQTPPEVEAEVLRLYQEEGLGARKISARVGIAVTTVFNILNRAGVERSPGTRKVAVDMRARSVQIVDLYNSGMSGPAIASQLGISFKMVYRALRDAGITASDASRRNTGFALSEEQEATVVSLYKEGALRNALADQFGIHPRTIDNILDRYDVESRYQLVEFSDSQLQDIKEQWLAGETQAAIAESFGVHVGHVKRALGKVLSDEDKSGHRRLRKDMGQGYISIYIPSDSPYVSMRTNGAYGPEHRYNMARKLGRVLLAGEEVHHRSGRRHDNSEDNLELWLVHQPRGQRVSDVMDYIAKYFPDEMQAKLNSRRVLTESI